MTRKRRGCRHENARTGMWRAGAQSWLDNTCLITDRLVCQSCGHWLPLGPSNDTGCEVEIRAAEIAAEHHSTGRIPKCRPDQPFEERCARCGWEQFIMPKAEPHAEWHAGYLARCIVDHNSATEREGRR